MEEETLADAGLCGLPARRFWLQISGTGAI